MYLETNYKVESVTRTEDGEVMEAWQHIPSGVNGRHIRDIEVPEDIEVSPGDIVRLTVENHTPDQGWVLHKFREFPYDEDDEYRL